MRWTRRWKSTHRRPPRFTSTICRLASIATYRLATEYYRWPMCCGACGSSAMPDRPLSTNSPDPYLPTVICSARSSSCRACNNMDTLHDLLGERGVVRDVHHDE